MPALFAIWKCFSEIVVPHSPSLGASKQLPRLMPFDKPGIGAEIAIVSGRCKARSMGAAVGAGAGGGAGAAAMEGVGSEAGGGCSPVAQAKAAIASVQAKSERNQE